MKQCVRHCCVLSLDLFSLYNELIMRYLLDIPRVPVVGHYMNILCYADETVLLAEHEIKLHEMEDIIAFGNPKIKVLV